MEQPIKKNKFSYFAETLPDLAFGFVHKRSGNEIRKEVGAALNTSLSAAII